MSSQSTSGTIQKNMRIENRLDVLSSGHIVTSSKGDILIDNGTKSIAFAVGNNGQILTASSDSQTGLVWSTAGPDVISNIGKGTGIFKQKTDNNFELKSIESGSTKLLITNTESTINLDVISANINIKSLQNAPTGTVVGTSDKQTLTNKKWGDDLDMKSHSLINLAAPVNGNDAANKQYVDNAISSLVDANINIFSNITLNASKIADGSVNDASFQNLSGVSSTVVGVSDTQSVTNKTFDSSNTFINPKIKTSIKDINNNNLIEVTPVDNAVNSLSISNAIAGFSPTMSVNGIDDNIDLNLTAKGDGCVKVSGLAYPSNDGTANQVLSTNGSGSITFANVPMLRVATGTTIDTTPLILSDLTIATTNNTIYLVEAKIVARRSDDGAEGLEGAGFIVRGTFKNINNILTEIKNGSMYLGEGKPVWSVLMNSVDTNITITVIGEAGKTIQWGGNVNVTSI